MASSASFNGFARAKLFEHVVNLREREAGVFGLALLAQRVEFLGAGADFGFERVGSVGKGEGVESLRFPVARVIANPKPTAGAQRPNRVESAKKERQENTRLKDRYKQERRPAKLLRQETGKFDVLKS